MQPNKTAPSVADDGYTVSGYLYDFSGIKYVSSLVVRTSKWTPPTASFIGAAENLDLSKLYNKDAPVFAITNDSRQAEQDRLLEYKCGFYRLLRFSGSYGNPLSLWVKRRVGDRKSMRGPLVRPIKNKATASLASAHLAGFAGCCGASICIAPEAASGTTVRWPEDSPYFPRCLKDNNTQINIFMLCEESKTDVIDTLKDTGFIPIYRYSTPAGVAFLVLFRDVGHSDYTRIPAVLYGRTEKPVLDIIKRLQGIKT